MNIICFHNPNEENGYLSNWYPSPFKIGNVEFSSMEQFMMYRKAGCFCDEVIAKKILSTDDIAEIKSLGREVSNYDEHIWNGVRQIVVYEGLLAKFSQNQDLKDRLKDTGGAVLAECAVKDLIWGTGLSMNDPNRFDMSKWRGQNLLGYTLMMVRERLQFGYSWEQRKLGECFTERIESMPDGELISVTINAGIKKFSELGRHDNSNDNKSKYKKVCVGDIAYNSMRMWQGASGYSPYEGIVSPAYTVLAPNPGINSKCLSYQFKLPKMIHTFQINSQGITSDNWNLKYPALSEIETLVSKDEEEQAKIAVYFDTIDNLITLHQRKLELRFFPGCMFFI